MARNVQIDLSDYPGEAPAGDEKLSGRLARELYNQLADLTQANKVSNGETVQAVAAFVYLMGHIWAGGLRPELRHRVVDFLTFALKKGLGINEAA